MKHFVFKQFEIARGWSLELSESVSKEILTLKPDGFNNSILWQIGHIVTSTEYFFFEIPDNMNHLPAKYYELFGSGTNPNHWDVDIPTVEELIAQMKEQLVRIQQIPAIRLNETLHTPIHGFQTIGDCASFSVLHEALHIGKIEEMERVLHQ